MVNITAAILGGFDAQNARERQNIQNQRQDAAFEALQQQFGDVAGDPVAFGQLSGTQQRQTAFDTAQEAAAQERRRGAVSNASRLYSSALQQGATPQEAAARMQQILPSLVGEEDAAAVSQILAENPEDAEQLFAMMAGPTTQQERFTDLTPEEAQQLGLNPGAVAQRGPDGRISILQGGRAPQQQQAQAGARILTPDEVSQLGFNPGTVVQLDQNGRARVLQRGDPDAADPESGDMSALETGLRRAAQTFLDLQAGGGAVDPDSNNPLQNLRNFVTRRTPGADSVMAALGDKNAEIANSLDTIKPSLLQGIVQATGMSARSLDSNRELQFYLDSLGDASKPVLTNFAALHAIDNAFGEGDILEQMLPPETMQEIRRRSGELQREGPRSTVTDNSIRDAAAQLGVSLEDIRHTAEKHGMTEQEVIKRLRGQ